MGADLRSDILDEILDPLARCLTPEVAERIVQLRASPRLQQRIDELGQKCNQGEISSEELAEYDTYLAMGNFVSLLKAKAKRILAAQNAA